MAKTAEEKSMSLVIISRAPHYEGEIDEDLDAFAAQEVEAYRERLKTAIQERIADCQSAHDAGAVSMHRQARLYDEKSDDEVLALKQGFAESMYLIDAVK